MSQKPGGKEALWFKKPAHIMFRESLQDLRRNETVTVKSVALLAAIVVGIKLVGLFIPKD